MTQQFARFLALSALGVLVAGGDASAHAMLKSARPGVGSTYATSPRAIELDFSEGVVPSFCSIVLLDSEGKPVHIGPLAKGASAKTLVAQLAGVLPAGTYTVTWRAVSVDTHRTQGSFRFTVGR